MPRALPPGVGPGPAGATSAPGRVQPPLRPAPSPRGEPPPVAAAPRLQGAVSGGEGGKAAEPGCTPKHSAGPGEGQPDGAGAAGRGKASGPAIGERASRTEPPPLRAGAAACLIAGPGRPVGRQCGLDRRRKAAAIHPGASGHGRCAGCCRPAEPASCRLAALLPAGWARRRHQGRLLF